MKKQIGLRLSEQQLKMIEEIKTATGYTSISSVLEYSLALCYQKIFPNYAKANENKVKKQNMTPEEKIKFQAEKELVKEQSKKQSAELKRLSAVENGERICSLIQGELGTRGENLANDRVCNYKTFSGHVEPTVAFNSTPQFAYLDEMTDKIIETQIKDIYTNKPLVGKARQKAIDYLIKQKLWK
jgi:hypothetical protein